MRRRPSRRSTLASMSADTRVMIAPTLRQAMRMSSVTAVLEVCTASQATLSSKSRVCPASWRAQGTSATVGPWVGQSTLTPRSAGSTASHPDPQPASSAGLALGHSPAPGFHSARTGA